jgi:dipeptidyl aminopeptidase/acylaminoacyl peptidase
MGRAPRPDDLYRLRVPLEPAISPDGSWVVFAVSSVAPGKDGYRTALWIAPADGSSAARQLTVGSRSDRSPRWSPDGRSIAFLSDRSAVLQAGGGGDRPGKAEAPEEGSVQVWLLPFADGGEARRLSDLPRDVSELAWSPDGGRLCLVSASTRATREPDPQKQPGEPPEPDLHHIDRLQYMLNGAGYIYDQAPNLWLLDIASGELSQLTSGRARDEQPAWSPNGRTIAFTSNRHRDADLTWQSDLYLVEVETRRIRRLTDGPRNHVFGAATWSPDGTWIAGIGYRERAPRGGTRSDVWRIRVGRGEGSAENLTGHRDLSVAAPMNSDLFGMAAHRLHWQGDGRWIVFAAPLDGAYQAWRVDPESKHVEQLTGGQHYLSGLTVASTPRGGAVAAAIRASAIEPPDVVTFNLPAGRVGATPLATRRLSALMDEAWGEIDLVAPQERWHDSDNRRIQGWFYPAPGSSSTSPAPVVVEIHGGPATLYGWSLMWEWQCLAGRGMSVYACNPRGSDGYGQELLSGNYRDWGDGPMRDVMSGLDALIADGPVDPDRMGVTGGSYGGYLTSWIVGHTDRFRAAVTSRSVNDLTSEMLAGDIGGPMFGEESYRAQPWTHPDLYRAHSPLTYAEQIRTPLLIQHAEKDLRTPINQGEELFSVLRALRRPVRFMRVPDETHELTRSGTPFRRVENLARIVEWFEHFLVHGRSGLPRIRRARRRR